MDLPGTKQNVFASALSQIHTMNPDDITDDRKMIFALCTDLDSGCEILSIIHNIMTNKTTIKPIKLEFRPVGSLASVQYTTVMGVSNDMAFVS